MFKRVFLIVMDSLGIGATEDAKNYGDQEANTIYHISEKMDLQIPNLVKLGYSNIIPLRGIDSNDHPCGYYTKMTELSVGKDTMTGHWEMMGLFIDKPFMTFTETGFPKDLIALLKEKTGHDIIGNVSASGTEIIKELGEEHLKTGALIVYTSADSVLQIAMHEGVIPIKRQYEISEIARKITLEPKWKVGRVITRPFVGKNRFDFKRTPNRHDYALKPFNKTVLNYLSDHNKDVIAIGKINDIFDGYGITQSQKTISNSDGMQKITELTDHDFMGLCFLNLVDFDALYGHRRDVIGYGKAIMEFDLELGELLKKLKDDDLLILTADHGNDPVHSGTDHTREYVPLIFYSKSFKEPKMLPISHSFADIGATIAANFNVELPQIGKSLLDLLK